MHRSISLSAAKNKRTLNEEVKIALAEHLNDVPRPFVVIRPALNADTSNDYKNYSSYDRPAYNISMGGIS